MAEYIERDAAKNSMCQYCRDIKPENCKHKDECNVICRLDAIPAADVRPIGLLEQVEWERDTALAQLAEIGKSLGEKMDDVRPVVMGEWGYRWKIHGDGRRPTELFPCSECGYENTSATNFCPNCGADMRAEEGEA